MIEYRIRKDDYISKWYAEKLEWGMVVRRYDFPSEAEAEETIKHWKEEAKMKMWVYGMRLRGFSPGCQPMGGFVERRDDPTNRYHDLIVYSRPLTDKEIEDFELDFIPN